MASYLTLPKLKEYVESYLDLHEDVNKYYHCVTEKGAAKIGIDGLMGYLESGTEINPEFVDMDAMRYRLAVETLVARANDRPLTDAQQVLLDALSNHSEAPSSVEEFSSWIDDAMRGKKTK